MSAIEQHKKGPSDDGPNSKNAYTL